MHKPIHRSMHRQVWENKDNFNAWRKGPAFKEAHGGGTVGGVFDAILGVITELKVPSN